MKAEQQTRKQYSVTARPPDRNIALRARIRLLAHRHRRYGAGMIYLKLRQEGAIVNYKRVDPLYTEEKLQIKRHRRKKVPITDRQPLLRPDTANEVWSMDFVFDRSADGLVVKCLTIVDDAMHESVDIVPERAIGALTVTRILERLATPVVCNRSSAPTTARSFVDTPC